MNGIHSGSSPVFAGMGLRRKAVGAVGAVALLAAAGCAGASHNDKKDDVPSKSPSVSASQTPGDAPSTESPDTLTPRPSTSAPSTSSPPSVSPSNPLPSYSALPIYPVGTVTERGPLKKVIQDMDNDVNQIERQWHTINLDDMTFKTRTMQQVVVQRNDSNGELDYQILDNGVAKVAVKDEYGKLDCQMTFQPNGNLWYKKVGQPNRFIDQKYVNKHGLNTEFQKLTTDIKKLRETLQPYLHI